MLASNELLRLFDGLHVLEYHEPDKDEQGKALASLIARHPRGLDMQLGEDGMGLSGGQKRLVALARVALRDPTVALLDEPTSGLDPNTEKAVLSSLSQWCAKPFADGRKRTIVIVTHRPQVLDIVERVIVVDAGRIIVDGPKEIVMQQLAKGISINQGNQPRPTIKQARVKPKVIPKAPAK
jgi:ATP-binding cassette subfamily C protein LapB